MSTYGQHTKNPGYKSGDNWVECEVCGMDIYASDIRTRWDGILVCPEDWEPRHEQDFVRARQENITAEVVNSKSEEVSVAPTEYSDQGADTTIPAGTFNPETL